MNKTPPEQIYKSLFRTKRKIIALFLILIFSFGLIPLSYFSLKAPIRADLWITSTIDSSLRLIKMDSIELSPRTYFDGSSNVLRIKIDENREYQEIQGFGAAMTDSSAWLLRSILNQSEYYKTMRALFDPLEGIGISLLRIPLGASDCALDYYSFDDTPWSLDDFSISRDEMYLIPVLQDALKLNPALKFIGTPWSPPGWMKEGNNLSRPETKGMIGGTLNRSLYTLYAQYLAKAILAYEHHGIKFSAITIQNEQFYVPQSYPGAYLGVEETTQFVKIFGSVFSEFYISTKIYILDHNWVYAEKAIEILSDPDANEYIDGIAWHGYENPESWRQSLVKERFPTKHHLFTEISGLQAYPHFEHNMVWTFHNIFTGSLRNWAEGVLFWNLALDQFGGPTLHNYAGLRGVLTIPRNNSQQIKDIIFEGEYFMIGHFSKFVQPGAKRIDSMYRPNSIETFAFKNPDGSFAIIIGNLGNEQEKIKLEFDARAAYINMPARCMITVRFKR